LDDGFFDEYHRIVPRVDLVVGMLVGSGACDHRMADRKLRSGIEPKWSFHSYAAKRMSWLIIASTATTLSVFPLLLGEGMAAVDAKFLPITVIPPITSLFMALIFICGLTVERSRKRRNQGGTTQPNLARDMTGVYRMPWRLWKGSAACGDLCGDCALLGRFQLYGQFGVLRSSLISRRSSARDKFLDLGTRWLVRAVEDRLLGHEIASIYARSMMSAVMKKPSNAAAGIDAMTRRMSRRDRR
jgi:multidrug efflux pump